MENKLAPKMTMRPVGKVIALAKDDERKALRAAVLIYPDEEDDAKLEKILALVRWIEMW